MKNKFIKIISVFTLLILLSGCVKYNANIKISNNKKMNFELIIAVSKQMQDQMGESGSVTVGDNESIEKLKELGWKVEEYEDDSYIGNKLTKTYDNIDDISSTDPNVEYDFNALFQDGTESSYMFYKKESDDKTTYYAKFKADVNSGMNGTETDDSEDLTEEEKEEQRQLQESTQQMMNSMMQSMDLKLTVEVPKVIKNNATSVDGNKLTWDLTKLENNSSIEFEFELTGNSFPVIPVIIGVGVVLLVVIVVVLVSSKKKSNKSTKPKESYSM